MDPRRNIPRDIIITLPKITQKENFLNLVKEIDFQEVQEAQRVPKNVGPKEEHTKAHHNYISQD